MRDETTTWFHGDGQPRSGPLRPQRAAQAEGEPEISERAQGAAGPESEDVPIAQVGKLLRGVGAAILLAAASTFLLQHWEAGNDLARYGGLVGLTALLTAAGFFTGIRLGETKGARTFLSVAAAVVPAHFCILGGLVYSQFAWGALQSVPEYASWVAPSGASALLTAAGAQLLLVPTALIALLALARSRARALAAVFLGTNALLLIPSRDPQTVSALLGVMVIGLAVFEHRVLQRDRALQTFEGVLVRGLLWAAPVLMALRSVLHYDLSAGFGFVVAASLAGLTFGLSRVGRVDDRIRNLLEVAATVPAAAACAFGAVTLEAAGLPDAAILPSAVLPFAGVLTVLSLVTGGRAAPWRMAATLVAMGGTALNLAVFESALAAFICLAVSVVGLGVGVAERRRGVALAGGAGALYALAHHVQAAIELYAWSSWGSLAALGVMVILAASLLERHPKGWEHPLAQWRARGTETPR